MNSFYDMVEGRFVDEPKEEERALSWADDSRWLELQLVPVTSERRGISMPPELARLPVDIFLASVQNISF